MEVAIGDIEYGLICLTFCDVARFTRHWPVVVLMVPEVRSRCIGFVLTVGCRRRPAELAQHHE